MIVVKHKVMLFIPMSFLVSPLMDCNKIIYNESKLLNHFPQLITHGHIIMGNRIQWVLTISGHTYASQTKTG